MTENQNTGLIKIPNHVNLPNGLVNGLPYAVGQGFQSITRKILDHSFSGRLMRNASAIAIGSVAVLGPLVFIEANSKSGYDLQLNASHAQVAADLVKYELEAKGDIRTASNRGYNAISAQDSGWQAGVMAALADHSKYKAQMNIHQGFTDSDLLAASTLLSTDSGADRGLLIVAARNALDRAAGRANLQETSHGNALLEMRDNVALFSEWADARLDILSDVLNDDGLLVNSNSSERYSEAFFEASAWGHVAASFLAASVNHVDASAINPDIQQDLVRLQNLWNNAGSADRQGTYLTMTSNTQARHNQLAALAYKLSAITKISESLVSDIDSVIKESEAQIWADAAEKTGVQTAVAP